MRETQDQLAAQKNEYEDKLSSLASSSTLAEREDFELEKEQMQKSIELISQEMKRLRHLRTSTIVKGHGSPEFEATVYTAKEIRLAKAAFKKWKALRTFGMAETVLTQAIKVKEANVISRSLGKKGEPPQIFQFHRNRP